MVHLSDQLLVHESKSIPFYLYSAFIWYLFVERRESPHFKVLQAHLPSEYVSLASTAVC